MAEYVDDYPTCAETFATLWISHERLDPTAVSLELGIQPSWSWKKGEIRNPGAKRPVYSKEGNWALCSKMIVQSRDVRRHIDWSLDRVEPKAEVLSKFRASGCQFMIACFWVSRSGEGGPTLSAATMHRLSALGIDLEFDIYFGYDEEDRIIRYHRARIIRLGKGRDRTEHA